jgi:osmotically-inducible protein OsmY
MQARWIVSTLIASAALAAPAYSAPLADNHVAFTKTVHREAPIIVSAARTADDEAITQQVVYTLANDASLAGRIGVQSLEGEVELTGIVTSPGQLRQAERDAMGVEGVRNVRNLLSTRIGGGRY